MRDPSVKDVNLSVLGIGCAVAFAVNATAGALMAAKYGDTNGPNTTAFQATLLGAVIVRNLITGYCIAREAKIRKVPPNLHITLVGLFLMLVNRTDLGEVQSNLGVYLAWLLTIPQMLLGADGMAKTSKRVKTEDSAS